MKEITFWHLLHTARRLGQRGWPLPMRLAFLSGMLSGNNEAFLASVLSDNNEAFKANSHKPRILITKTKKEGMVG